MKSVTLKSTNVNIKNYTSAIEAAKSMVCIEGISVEIHAPNVNKQYKDKICTGITFLSYGA